MISFSLSLKYHYLSIKRECILIAFTAYCKIRAIYDFYDFYDFIIFSYSHISLNESTDDNLIKRLISTTITITKLNYKIHINQIIQMHLIRLKWKLLFFYYNEINYELIWNRLLFLHYFSFTIQSQNFDRIDIRMYLISIKKHISLEIDLNWYLIRFFIYPTTFFLH